MYVDFSFDEQFIDDSQEVTCAMCHEDCPLALIKSGCCAYCASLCASAPKSEPDPFTRRAHLISLTRRAFLLWSDACDLFNERVTALRPSADCIEEADLLCKHRLRRLNILESRLSEETGLDKGAVYNQIAAFPACSRLLRAGL